MSSLFQGLAVNGVLPTGPGPAVSWFRGLPFNANGALVVGNGPAVSYQNGVGYNAAGELVGVDSANGTYGAGATSLGVNSELAGGTGTAVVYHQGVPYNSTGGYSTDGGATLAQGVSKNFTLVPAQIDADTVGFNASAGSLSPDHDFAGGAIASITASRLKSAYFGVRTVGDIQLPGLTPPGVMFISGSLTRTTLNWVTFPTKGYFGTLTGIYDYLSANIGVSIPVTLSGTGALAQPAKDRKNATTRSHD